MARDRKLWIVVALAVLAVVATSPVTFGAESSVRVTVAGTSGSVVYATVSNTTNSDATGLVTVRGVVAGLPVTVSVPFAVPAGGTVVVPVVFAAVPARISCGVATDSGDVV